MSQCFKGLSETFSPFISVSICYSQICQSDRPLLEFVSGRTNLSIPWSNVKNDQSVWFQDESLPPSLVLQDPSKMSRSDVERLLDYWQQKEEDGVQPVEWKSSCPLLYSIAPRIPVVHRPPPAKHLPTAPIDPTPPPPTSPLASEDQHGI